MFSSSTGLRTLPTLLASEPKSGSCHPSALLISLVLIFRPAVRISVLSNCLATRKTIGPPKRLWLVPFMLLTICASARSQSDQFLPEIDTYLKLNSVARASFQAKQTREGGDPTQVEIGPSIDFYLNSMGQTTGRDGLRFGRRQKSSACRLRGLSSASFPEYHYRTALRIGRDVKIFHSREVSSYRIETASTWIGKTAASHGATAIAYLSRDP